MLDQTLWWISIAADGLALIALVARGLAPSFPVFTAFLVYNFLEDIVLRLLPGPATRIYAISWMISQPLMIASWVVIVLELFRRLCDHYPGVGKSARLLLGVALAIASTLTILTLGPDFHGIDWHRPALQLIVLLDRSTSTVLAAALLVFAAWFFYPAHRVPTRPNVFRHGAILLIYFGVHVSGMLMVNLLHDIPTQAVPFGSGPMVITNRILFLGRIACAIAWALLLTRDGEKVPYSATLSEIEIAEAERRYQDLREVFKALRK